MTFQFHRCVGLFLGKLSMWWHCKCVWFWKKWGSLEGFKDLSALSSHPLLCRLEDSKRNKTQDAWNNKALLSKARKAAGLFSEHCFISKTACERDKQEVFLELWAATQSDGSIFLCLERKGPRWCWLTATCTTTCRNLKAFLVCEMCLHSKIPHIHEVIPCVMSILKCVPADAKQYVGAYLSEDPNNWDISLEKELFSWNLSCCYHKQSQLKIC